MHWLCKYPSLDEARCRPDAELRRDLEAITSFIGTHEGDEIAVRVSVMRDWIAQALNLRHVWHIDASF